MLFSHEMEIFLYLFSNEICTHYCPVKVDK